MSRLLVASLLLLLGAHWASSQRNPLDLFRQAESAYDMGDYQTAISAYEELVASGVRDGALYFNLGNAYYEAGDLGRALLNYRRAQELVPRDADLSTSLARVRSRRVDIEGDETPVLDSLTALTTSILTLKELGWLALGLWTIWCGGLTAWISRPDWRETLRIALLVLGGLALFAGLLLGSRLVVMSNRPAAVVVEPVVDAMSGPGEDYLEHFRLYSGAEVRILEERGGWVRFVLPDGRQGWGVSQAFEKV